MFHHEDNVGVDMVIPFHNVNLYKLLYKHIYMVEKEKMMIKQEMMCMFHGVNKLRDCLNMDQANILCRKI
jgi:hypothetical protein